MVEPYRVLGSNGTSELLLYALTKKPGPNIVQEGAAYKFRFVDSPDGLIEPSERFEVDPDDSKTGRFRPENHVGTMYVVLEAESGDITFEVEVRSAKLRYESEYRELLEQVADDAAEAVLQGFAPSSRVVSASSDAVGELEYRSMAFVAARLRDEAFQAAIDHILRKPHRRWRAVGEQRPIARGLPAGANLGRALSQPGRRTSSVPIGLQHVSIPSLPQFVEQTTKEVSYDTNPNRFIRFVFGHWQGQALTMERRLAGSMPIGAGPRRRGLKEARWIIDRCEEVLTSTSMENVGSLRHFPHGDPVLLRQPGYREVLRTFALAEASMMLDVSLADDMFSATQRNIATLYEYWCFLVLVRTLSQICGAPRSGELFKPSAVGLSLVLREGSESRMSWTHEAGGRNVTVDLWFNQTFRRSQADGVEIGSWASSVRPDASLRIRPLSGRPAGAGDPHLDTWIHFDAKFRLDLADSPFLEDDPKSTVKRADLLKMHAYRDLIRRSAGAYVLYPGSGNPQRSEEFHEILPGIGAFPLRPGDGGTVAGGAALAAFLREVLQLTANQASANERSQFWRHRHTAQAGRRVRAVNFLSRPPADELVLIGFARPRQLPWIFAQGRYNLRGDGRRGSVRTSDELLSAQLILLWTTDAANEHRIVGLFQRTGPWQIASVTELVADGYPTFNPSAKAYLVTGIASVTSGAEALIQDPHNLPLPDDFAPIAIPWDQIVRC